MNELIEKLSKEANAWYPKGYPSPEGGDEAWQNTVIFEREDLRKFAELIVRECANHCDLLLDHKISSEWSRGTHDCSRAIKKHFGVEE